jgi:hypothetical protein
MALDPHIRGWARTALIRASSAARKPGRPQRVWRSTGSPDTKGANNMAYATATDRPAAFHEKGNPVVRSMVANMAPLQ